MHKRGNKGRITELSEQIQLLQIELEQAEKTNAHMAELAARQAELRALINRYEQKITELRNSMEKARAFDAKSALDKIDAAKQELAAAITESEQAISSVNIPGITVDRAYCGNIKDLAYQTEKEVDKLKLCRENLLKAKDELERAKLRVTDAERNAQNADLY
jgi:DNA repair ATPase RecN